MSWGITMGCIVISLVLSITLIIRDQGEVKVSKDLSGFVTEKKTIQNKVYFTLLSLEYIQPVLFVLPLGQGIKELREGDYIHVEYEVIPSFLDKPIFVRRLEIIEPLP